MIKFDKLRMWIIHANIFLDFLILDKEFVRSVYKKNSQISSISSNKKIFFLILIFCLFVCFRLRRLKPNCKAGVIICGTRKQLLWLHCFSPFCVCVFYLRNIFFFLYKNWLKSDETFMHHARRWPIYVLLHWTHTENCMWKHLKLLKKFHHWVFFLICFCLSLGYLRRARCVDCLAGQAIGKRIRNRSAV